MSTVLKSKKTWIITAAAVAGVLVLWLALSATGAAPSWLPSPFGSSVEESATASGEELDGTGNKATATQTSTKTQTVPVAGEAPDVNGTDDDPATTPDPGTPDDSSDGDGGTTPPAAKTMTLRILWWNDTSQKAPEGFEVVVGSVSWKPEDETAESATGRIAGLPFDRELELVVYPDGRSGSKVTVPIVLTADMVSDSEGDAVHVEVSDGKVRVLGTPVDNFDVTNERF